MLLLCITVVVIFMIVNSFTTEITKLLAPTVETNDRFTISDNTISIDLKPLVWFRKMYQCLSDIETKHDYPREQPICHALKL